MEEFVRTDTLEETIENLYDVESVSLTDTSPIVYSISHTLPEDMFCSMLSHIVPAFLTNLEDEDSEVVVYINSVSSTETEIYISWAKVSVTDTPDKI
jgi:hypothetical protein